MIEAIKEKVSHWLTLLGLRRQYVKITLTRGRVWEGYVTGSRYLEIVRMGKHSGAVEDIPGADNQ